MRRASEIPAVDPEVSTHRARSASAPTHQASPQALIDEPFSDYNTVLPTGRVQFDAPPPPTDTPTPGQPHTVFKDTVQITWAEGGDWVKEYISANAMTPQVKRARTADNAHRFVVWTARELYDQVQLWLASARADMEALKRDPSHRPRTKTLMIPDHCHRGNGKYTWDLRPFLAALAAGEPTDAVEIPHLDTSAHIEPSLNADALRTRMRAAGIRDQYGIQQLLELGVVSDSDAPRHTVLQINYPAVGRHAAFAEALVQREAREGKLSAPFADGFPLFPLRLNPYNAIEREGKNPRLCGDLSSPQQDRDGAGQLSMNAGMRLDDEVIIGRMRLTSAQAFARDLGIILAARHGGAPECWAATADWEAFYRQFPKPLAEIWGQLLWLDPAGPQIDWTVVFGDAAAPAQANRIQNILLELVASEFERQLEVARASASTEAEQQAWAAVDRWQASRLAALRRRFPERWAEAAPWNGDTHTRLRIWRARQRRLAILHGFFDDSLLASFVFRRETKRVLGDSGTHTLTRAVGPFELLVASLLTVAEDIGLPVAAHKIECGTPDGEGGRICIEQWQRHREAWWSLEKARSMVALGKELSLTDLRLRDTQARLRAFLQKVRDLNAAANANLRNKRPTVPIHDLQTVVGQAFFILQSEDGLRSAMNVPIRCLAVVSATAPKLEAAFRKAHPRPRRDRYGLPIYPRFRRCYLDPAAQTALMDMALAASRRRGSPFNPATISMGDGDRRILWILQDASGSEGGGGGAVYLDPSRPRLARWSYEPFTQLEARGHSTFLEGLNANRNLRRAAEAGYADIIEVLDNSAWVFVARSGASSDPALAELLSERAAIQADHKHISVYTVWQRRTQGQLADAVSKLELPYEADSASRHESQPATGRDWAHRRLQESGFTAGMADSHRNLAAL